MSEKIKVILDRLERIDHKEYCCGFEFADSSTFDETCRCFEERKKLADYITNLQEENNRLNNIINGMEKFFKYAYDNEVRPLNDRKISVWTICLDKLKELKEEQV